MIHKSFTVLPNMSGKVTYESEPVKGIGYYSYCTNARLNTFSIYTSNFTGRIYIYGTTKLEPKDESDWVVIPLTEETDYLEFDNYGKVKVKHDNTFINIKGCYTWFKVKMDRDYLNVFKTPVSINYHIHSGTEAQNIGDHVIMGDRCVEVTPTPGHDLALCGNVELVQLTY